MKRSPEADSQRTVLLAAAVFAVVGLLLQWWRLQVLTASYDQGIFLQVLWSGLQGHPFESTLSSQLSTNVIHAGELPAVGYHRLGQHFTPILLLWSPLVAVFGIWALPLVQVGLITAAGLVLHRLARNTLVDPRLAAFVACSFYAANAVIGPTWGNFTDLCQLPLAFFLLMLGLQRQRWWLVAVAAVALPLIREDTGVLLVGIALWMVVRRQHPLGLAMALGGLGIGWVLLVTNLLMPIFSDDNSRRFMVENFGQYHRRCRASQQPGRTEQRSGPAPAGAQGAGLAAAGNPALSAGPGAAADADPLDLAGQLAADGLAPDGLAARPGQ